MIQNKLIRLVLIEKRPFLVKLRPTKSVNFEETFQVMSCTNLEELGNYGAGYVDIKTRILRHYIIIKNGKKYGSILKNSCIKI